MKNNQLNTTTITTSCVKQFISRSQKRNCELHQNLGYVVIRCVRDKTFPKIEKIVSLV